MKLAILTQPLFFNYGGLLQAYALQTILERMGHEVIILNRETTSTSGRFPNNLVLDAKYFLRKILRKPNVTRNSRQNKLISSKTKRFIDKYLHITPSLYTEKMLADYVNKHPQDGFVVGSDQVWRPSYSPSIGNYFLDFSEGKSVKRLAYAASLGVDYWEFSEEDTNKCAALANHFDGISVREASGVALCKEFLGVDAVHVLDPTMLLEKADYTSIFAGVFCSCPSNGLFYYILNVDEEKEKIIRFISEQNEAPSYTCMPELYPGPDNIEKNPSKCIYPTVDEWLYKLSNAKVVVTDSFHGTVFSIIFNKPFWVIRNEARGNTRIESLLDMFGLSNRLIDYKNLRSNDCQSEIDWEMVNSIKSNLSSYSVNFLKNFL